MLKHLEEAQAHQGGSDSPKPRSVILAPFGLAGTLTGQSNKASDPQTQKVLDDWSAFYPISNKNMHLAAESVGGGGDLVPPIVEIMTGKLIGVLFSSANAKIPNLFFWDFW